MVLDKFKQKMLDSSDSYNFYKDEFEKSDKKIQELSKKIDKLQKEHDKTLKSYNELFNTLYLDFELTPRPLLEKVRILGYEILIFMDNVCKKHGLEWWLDGGTLLGAVRHQDYIPWDDDLDIAMLRADYNRFVDVIHEEIENNNLTNVTAEFQKEKHYRWIQLHYKHPDYFEKKFSFVGLDIFPFDYLDGYHGQDIEDEYQKARVAFNDYVSETLDYDTALKTCYETLNLKLERADHYISGVEGTRGPVNTYDLVVMQTDKLLPLKRMDFGPYQFPVPNDEIDYVTAQYGKNYLQIPKNIRTHGRVRRLRPIEDILGKLDEAILIFRNANENFK